MPRPSPETRVALALICLSAAAARAEISVNNEQTHVFEVSAGQRQNGKISIRNYDKVDREARIYRRDYGFSYTGKDDYAAPGTLSRSNANWITLSRETVVVPADASVEISFTLTVPADETLQGTYWSVIMVEGPPSVPKAPAGEQPERSIRINYIRRTAVQIVANIGQTGTPKPKILHKQLLTEDQTSVVLVDIENVGDRWLRPTYRLEVYDADGGQLGVFTTAAKRIYPGTSIHQRFILEGIKSDQAKQALLVIDNGDEYVFGHQFGLPPE